MTTTILLLLAFVTSLAFIKEKKGDKEFKKKVKQFEEKPEERTLTTEKDIFLMKEYAHHRIFPSFGDFVDELGDDVATCGSCKSYYWKGCEKMCACL